jgi:hypothetical protein
VRNATRVTVSSFGALAGLAGIEHGIGETLQGNLAPGGIMISSWPGSALFGILSGEPAMTVVPNPLVSGILTILFSLIFLVWASVFVQRKNGGLILILLSIALLLVGGGFGPPMLGIIVGVTATRIYAPLTRWQAHLSAGSRRFLAKLWPWSFVAGLVAWLLLFPGSVLLDYFLGVSKPELVISIFFFSALGFLLLTIVAGLLYDSQEQMGQPSAPPVTSGRPASRVGR